MIKNKKNNEPAYVKEENSHEKLKINFLPKTANQKEFSKLIKSNIITIASGPAGTGKTYVAEAEALRLLVNPENEIHKIVLVKSVSSPEGEEIGFVRGSVKDKMEPHMVSFFENFYKIVGEPSTNRLIEAGVIVVRPISFLRGLSIDNSVIIVDESQNIRLKDMRTILTRIGDNSKMIILGDSKQIDLKTRNLSSLDIVFKLFGDKSQFGVVEFTKEDIVRNPIVRIIEDTFDEYEKEIITNSNKKGVSESLSSVSK